MFKKTYKYLVSYSFIHTETYTLGDNTSNTIDTGGNGSAYIDINYKIKTINDINNVEEFLFKKLNIDNLKKVNITSFNLLKG